MARRAHVAQSVVRAYGSGRRELSLTTLRRLVAATGHRLVGPLGPDADARPELPDTPLGCRVRRHRRALLATAARHGATNVRVFGSVVRGEDRPDSDVDLLANLAPGTGLAILGTLERELGEVLGSPVGVIPVDSLRASVRADAEQEAIPL